MTNRDANRYPAKCARCGLTVPAGEGFMTGGKPGEPWRVVHPACIPVSRSSQ